MAALGPRLVIAGTHSGVGKTTIATGLMAAFSDAGVKVAAAKVGPDFIDPGYHSLATGRPGRNLDPWICGSEAMPSLAARAGAGADLLIVEGVMGLFDGAVDGAPSSTAHVADLLASPVVLVVDGSSMSASVAALVRGFRDHDPTIDLAGVILNRVGSEHHRTLLTEALASIDVAVLGCLPRHDALTWRDRHLGLVPVAERPSEVAANLDRLATEIIRGCDLDRLLRIAGATSIPETGTLPTARRVAPVRLAVAGGPAFTFYYRDNLEALEEAGAELLPFDPLTDRSLPEQAQGLLIGGGFPEVFGPGLADNQPLLDEVASSIRNGLVTWAECGGLLWLARALDGRRLCGVIEADGSMTGRLTLGYRRATALSDNPVAAGGEELRGHEFHYSRLEPAGDALALSSRFVNRNEGFASPTMLATYLHQHLGATPERAERFVGAIAAGARPEIKDEDEVC